jgi:hypothetical protein
MNSVQAITGFAVAFIFSVTPLNQVKALGLGCQNKICVSALQSGNTLVVDFQGPGDKTEIRLKQERRAYVAFKASGSGSIKFFHDARTPASIVVQSCSPSGCSSGEFIYVPIKLPLQQEGAVNTSKPPVPAPALH